MAVHLSLPDCFPVIAYKFEGDLIGKAPAVHLQQSLYFFNYRPSATAGVFVLPSFCGSAINVTEEEIRNEFEEVTFF